MDDGSKIKIIQDPSKKSAIEEIPQDLKATTLSGLKELQNLLPHGDLGRIVNSFIFINHPDAVLYQRSYRQSMYNELMRFDPFAFTYDSDQEEESNTFSVDFSMQQGFGYIDHCKKCKIPLYIIVCQDVDWMNLKISEQYAMGWCGPICQKNAIGFNLPIDRCLCFVSDDSDEVDSDEVDSDEDEYVPYD